MNIGKFIFALGWITAFLNPILKEYKSTFQFPVQLISALIIAGFALIIADVFVKIYYVDNKGGD